MAGHGFLHVDIGIDDLEESKSILVNVDAAEFSNFIGCIFNEANEVTTEVCMNLRSLDEGKVVGARRDGSQSGNGAGANTSKDMVEVFCGEKVIGLVWRTGEVALLGVEFGVVGGRSTHAVNEVDIKEIRLCQMLLPFLVMGNGNMCSLKHISLAVRPQENAPHRRTLSHATNFDQQGSQ
jgi:hypothetical protein